MGKHTLRKSTVEYVYAKLKTEMIRFVNAEIELNDSTDGEAYLFSPTEQALYEIFCKDMIRALEDTEINYDALVAELEENRKPF